MNQNIHELTKALRDAAKAIEDAAKFRFAEEIDLDEAVAVIQALKSNASDAKLVIRIGFPYGKVTDDDPITVEYQIDEGYSKKAEGASLKNCIDAYASTKEGANSLGSLSRLVKAVSKTAEKEAEQSDDSAKDIATESDAL